MKVKRIFDLVVVSLAAIVWVPVVLISALAVLVFSGRPIFYTSRRWVRAEGAINMLKLRVMIPNADQVPDVATGDTFLNTVADSPLYTRVGRILDRLGLNEIPQFVHVLRGDMSIVGPRPLTDAVRDALIDAHGEIDDRWQVSPAGLTGLPQLVGRSALTDRQRLDLENAYSRMAATEYRLFLDFKILLFTVLITFGLKKTLTVDEALSVVEPRVTRVRSLRPRTYPTPTDVDAVA